MGLDPSAFLDEFRGETTEHLRFLDIRLLPLEREPGALEPIREMLRSAHSIKGGAAMLGLTDVFELVHALEDVLVSIRGGGRPIGTATVELLFKAIDVLRLGVATAQPGEPRVDAGREALIATLGQHARSLHDAGAAPAPSRQARALVVDASATVRILSRMLLSDVGFVVDMANDGVQALSAVEKEQYDLVVSAVETDGVSGLELAAALRDNPLTRGVPIVLCSSYENAEHQRQAIELGVHAYLPKGSLGDRRLAEIAAGLVTTKPSVTALRILVVDDSTMVQLVTVAQLEQLGYTAVDVADSGRAALQALANTRYAAVFMDCQMPDLDGFGTARAIRYGETRGVHIPIIAVTADTSAEGREYCVSAGMDDYLSKPVQMDALATCLGRWVPHG
jgi:CheY-like chemotaxis protein/HPt (histidine-containing phosphotransfer) domain-containing protein